MPHRTSSTATLRSTTTHRCLRFRPPPPPTMPSTAACAAPLAIPATSGGCSAHSLVYTNMNAAVVKESPNRTTICHGLAKGCASCLPPRNTDSHSLKGTHKLYVLLKIASVDCSETCAVSMQDVVQCLGRVRQRLQPEGRRGGAVPAVHHEERRPLCVCLGQPAALHQRLPGAPLGAAPAALAPQQTCSAVSAASMGDPTPRSLLVTRAAQERS